MDLNDSFNQDLEMDVREAEDVKGGRSLPKRKLPNGRGRTPRKPKSPQVSAASPNMIVDSAKRAVDPERPF